MTQGEAPEISERYRTDCRRCKGLCCTVTAHIPGNGFPGGKPANQRCRHLTADHQCRIFESLESEGYTVCRAYDCHGAGPSVSRWIDADGEATPKDERFEDFRQLSRLHLLAVAIHGERESVESLFGALDSVSLAYTRTGTFEVSRVARNALRKNESFVTDVLNRLDRRSRRQDKNS
jgi:hypothetical protein